MTGTSCKAVLNSRPDKYSKHVLGSAPTLTYTCIMAHLLFVCFFPPSINFSAAISFDCALKDPVSTGRAELPLPDCRENQKWRLKKGGPRGEKTSYKQISSWSRGRQPLCSWTGAGSCLQLRPKDLQGSGMPRETQQSAKQYNMNQQTRPASWTSLQVWEKSKENKSWAQRLLDLSLRWGVAWTTQIRWGWPSSASCVRTLCE